MKLGELGYKLSESGKRSELEFRYRNVTVKELRGKSFEDLVKEGGIIDLSTMNKEEIGILCYIFAAEAHKRKEV